MSFVNDFFRAVFLGVFYSLGLLFEICLFLNRRKSFREMVWVILLLSLSLPFKFFFQDSGFQIFYSVFLYSIMLFLPVKLFDTPFPRALRVLIVILLLSVLGDVFSLFLCIHVLGWQEIPHWTEKSFLLPVILSNSTQVFLAFLYHTFVYKRKKTSIYLKDQVVPVLLLWIEVFSILWFYLASMFSHKGLFLSTLTLQILIEAAGIYLLVDLIRNVGHEQREKRLQELEENNRRIYELLKQNEDAYRRLHKIRHDFRNQLMSARLMADAGEGNKAEALFLELERQLEDKLQTEKQYERS